uniref:Protein LURP-one-related 15-like n=1 Tax=Tanacetum cinerariifolium TaxID=118510 RepID=A0A6L2MWG3_TANCI|nr:hypothetical protein [Tanacetum cinerariifolium]
MVNPFTIISSRFLGLNPLDLSIVRNPFTLTKGNYTVTNTDGRVMFEVQGSLFSLLWRLPFRREWDVYKGESKEKLFSDIRSLLIPYKTSLNVFLGCNPKQNVCEFRVEGSWFNQSCTIYAQDGTTTVAKMQRSHSFESIALGKDRFDVTVYPNVDYAFIVSLVVILDQSKTYGSVNNVPSTPLIPTSSNEIEKEESRSSPLAIRGSPALTPGVNAYSL